MIFWKKFLTLLLTGVMILSLVDCGGNDSGEKADDKKVTAEKYGEFKKLANQLYEVTYDYSL